MPDSLCHSFLERKQPKSKPNLSTMASKCGRRASVGKALIVIVSLVAIFNNIGLAQCGWKRSRDLNTSPKANQASPDVVFDPTTGRFRNKSQLISITEKKVEDSSGSVEDLAPLESAKAYGAQSREAPVEETSGKFIQRRKRIRHGLRKRGRGRVSIRRVKNPIRSDKRRPVSPPRVPKSRFRPATLEDFEDASIDDTVADRRNAPGPQYKSKFRHYSDPNDVILPSSSNTYLTEERFNGYYAAPPSRMGQASGLRAHASAVDNEVELTSLAPVTYDYTIGQRNYEPTARSVAPQSSSTRRSIQSDRVRSHTDYPGLDELPARGYPSSTPFSLYIDQPKTTTTSTTTSTTTTTAAQAPTITEANNVLLKKRGKIEPVHSSSKKSTKKYSRKPSKQPSREAKKPRTWKPSTNREEIRERFQEEFTSTGLKNEVAGEYPKTENAKFPHFPTENEISADDQEDKDVYLEDDQDSDSPQRHNSTPNLNGGVSFNLSQKKLPRLVDVIAEPTTPHDELQDGQDSLLTPSLSKSSVLPFENARLPKANGEEKRRKSGRDLPSFGTISPLYNNKKETSTTTSTSTTTTSTPQTLPFEWGKKSGDEEKALDLNEEKSPPFEYSFKSRRPSPSADELDETDSLGVGSIFTSTVRPQPFDHDNIYTKEKTPFSVIPPHATPQSLLDRSQGDKHHQGRRPTQGPFQPFKPTSTPDLFDEAIARSKRKQHYDGSILSEDKPEVPIHKEIDRRIPGKVASPGHHKYSDYFAYGVPSEFAPDRPVVEKDKTAPGPPLAQGPSRPPQSKPYYKPALSFEPSPPSSQRLTTTERLPHSTRLLTAHRGRDHGSPPPSFGLDTHPPFSHSATVTVRPYGHPSTLPPMHQQQDEEQLRPASRPLFEQHREEESDFQPEHPPSRQNHALESETQTSSPSSYYNHPFNRDHADIERLPQSDSPKPALLTRGHGTTPPDAPTANYDRYHHQGGDILAPGSQRGSIRNNQYQPLHASPTERSAVKSSGDNRHNYPVTSSSYSGFGTNYDQDESDNGSSRDRDHSIYENADQILKSYDLKKVVDPEVEDPRTPPSTTTNKELFESIRNDKIYHQRPKYYSAPTEAEEHETFDYDRFQERPRHPGTNTKSPLVIQDYFGNPTSAVGRYSQSQSSSQKLKREHSKTDFQSQFSKAQFNDDFFSSQNEPFIQSSSMRHTSTQKFDPASSKQGEASGPSSLANPRTGSRGIGFDFSAEFPPFPSFAGGLASISRMHNEFAFGNDDSESQRDRDHQ